MKFRLFAVVLVLSLLAWAQANPAASTNSSDPATKNSCPHAAKDGMTCCHHSSTEAKDAMSCCEGKDMKDAKSCCSPKEMKNCMKQCTKDGGCADGKCCGAAGEKSAMNCCGNHCQRHAQAASAS